MMLIKLQGQTLPEVVLVMLKKLLLGQTPLEVGGLSLALVVV